MNPSDPLVKDVRVEAPIDGISVVKADGVEVYRGSDSSVIKAWAKAAMDGSSLQDLLVNAAREPPLLQCIDCKNTESPAGAMARYFNKGRCLHCGGWFKVVRA